MDEAMADEVILSIQHVSKRFGGTQALKDVSFDIRQGEIHALMGENGAGKSTLVKIISSVIGKDSGNILFKGQDLKARNPQESRALGDDGRLLVVAAEHEADQGLRDEQA